jgi:Na+/H+-dicarboxylate symporter
MSSSGRIVGALALGVGAGIVARVLGAGPAEASANLAEPIGMLWTNAMRLAVIPLVIVSILGAVLRSTASVTVGRMGAGVFGVAAGLLISTAIVSLLVGPAFFDWTPLSPETLATLRDHHRGPAVPTVPAAPFREWFIQLIPANPFKALADGAMLAIVIATLGLSLAARRLEPGSRDALGRLAERAADLLFTWIGWVLWLAPLGVFTLMFAITVRSGGGVAIALAAYLLITIALCLVIAAVLYGLVGLSRVTTMTQFAQVALAPQLVGFSSRSSQATLPLMIERAKSLGLPPEASQALLPLLVSVFRVTSAVVICIGVVFVAWLYGVELRPDQLVTVGILSLLLSIAMPGVPAAGVLATAPVLAEVGLPVEGLAILLAIDPIGDMFRTGTNVTAHLALTVLASRILRSSPR